MTATLLRSVRRVPLDGEPVEPVDVLLADGRIVALGVGLGHADAVIEEGDGRWIAPGLWDEHTHFEQWAQTALRVDTAGTFLDRGALWVETRADRRDPAFGQHNVDRIARFTIEGHPPYGP